MNKLILCTLLLCSGSVHGVALSDLINQNVQRSNKSYDQSLAYARLPVTPAQLWIHIRNDNQQKLADEILDTLARQQFQKANIEPMPVQKVDAGPRKNQLRYFKRQDQKQAEELFSALRKLIPQIELSDASGRYQNVDWIKPGHYELWLAPELMLLQHP